MELIIKTIDLFHKGGPVMYLLLACSLSIVTVAVERFLYYRSIGANSHLFQNNLQTLLEKQHFSEAMHLSENTPAAIAKIALAGLQAHQRGSQPERALETAAGLAADRLRERLDVLSMIVTLAPLLGLLGTVIGMISSFSVFSVQNGQPLAITGGVGEALVATATGLSVATVSLILHSFLSRKANRLIGDVEQTAGMVSSYLPVKNSYRRNSHEIA